MRKMHRGPFGVIPEWVILAAEPTALKVYAVLASHYANGDRVCFPRQETVAEFAGMSASTVKRSISQLVKIGAIEVKRTSRGSKRGHNVYYLPLVKGQICPPVEDEYGSDLPLTESKVGGADDPSITRPTKEEPDKYSGAGAPGGLFEITPPPGRPEAEERQEPKERTLGQRANALAREHYDRLGGFGNIVAWHGLIKKALELGYTDQAVSGALAYIAEHNWVLTGEKLSNTLKGGPKRPTRSAAAAVADRDAVDAQGRPVFDSYGHKIVYGHHGEVLDI